MMPGDSRLSVAADTAEAPAETLISHTRTSFGSYLILPSPTEAPDREDAAPPVFGSWRVADTDDLDVASFAAGKQQARLRWVTGHQVSFVIWRLLAEAVPQIGSKPMEAPVEVRVVQLIDAYTAALRYAASVSGAAYRRRIRPEMREFHPALSGSWAPDFVPVRRFIRANRYGSAVASAWQRHQRVHELASLRLTDGDDSMLAEFSAHGGALPARAERGRIYDAYFKVHRGKVDRRQVLRQTLSRLAVIEAEVAQNGLDDWGAGSVAAASPASVCVALSQLAAHLHFDVSSQLAEGSHRAGRRR